LKMLEGNANYIAILTNLVFAAAFAIGMVAVDFLVGPKRPGRTKSLPYECGFVEDEPRDGSGDRIFVRFIVVAMLFILFDVETIFLYPWAVLFKKLGFMGFVEMLAFVFVLMFGLYYVVKKGVFEWD